MFQRPCNSATQLAGCWYRNTLPSALISIAATLLPVAVSATAPSQATLDKIAKLSVPFVPNAGQWDLRAAFAAQTFAGTLFVTKQGELVYSLPGKPIAVGEQSDSAVGAACREPRSYNDDLTQAASFRAKPLLQRDNHCTERSPGWVLSETLVDGKGHARPMSQSTLKAPAGYRPMEGKVSYGIGNDPSKHADNLNTYERVNLGDMYAGINVQLRATGNNVEKIFTVAPNHDPKQIQIKLAGAEKLEIGAQGELIAHTGNGPVTFTAPIAFQDTASGERHSVTVAYALVGADLAAPVVGSSDATKATPGGRLHTDTYRFALGAYDPTLPLVIDPLLQSTYHGGAGIDRAYAIAIHPASGDVYIAGYSASSDLPSTTNANGGVATGAQSVLAGGEDAFVTRFNAALTQRKQTSYFGGADSDVANAIAIQPATGDVYVAGHTDSADLPARLGGGQPTKSGGRDAFVSRFNEALTSHLQTSYMGGAGTEVASSMLIHPMSGDVYIAGSTTSPDLLRVNPLSGGIGTAAQAAKSSGSDAFIGRFNATLTQHLQSTYFGGTGNDDATALAVHPATGEVYIAGSTSAADLPGTVGGAQQTRNAGFDAYVSRFNAGLTQRVQSTYWGGGGTDAAQAIAIHPMSGDVYIVGYTDSVDLPGVANGAQPSRFTNISNDAFVSRFNAALTQHLQSSYLGGSADDIGNALAIHPVTGQVYVSGYTDSTDLPSASGGAQSTKSVGASLDGFVTRFDATLTRRFQSSYLGGTSFDYPYALAIHPASGQIYLTGYTGSTSFPGSSGGAQPIHTAAGSSDAFVSRFSMELANGDDLPDPFAFAPNLNVPVSSIQTSNSAQILGISGNVPISLLGGNFAQYCVSSSAGCACDALSYRQNASTITNGLHVCVRQVAPANTPAQSKATLIVGGGWANFLVGTGTEITSCNLDIDGSGGAPNAVSDGLMLVRAMLGFTGTAVTDGAISGSPPRNTWALIRQYLNDNCGTNFAP